MTENSHASQAKAPETFVVEVAFALPHKQKIISLTVPEGTTPREAVKLSKILEAFPGENIENARLGMFGQAFGVKGGDTAESYKLQNGDRVEIYRPLIADPKEVRRKRAEKAKAEKNGG